MKTEMKFRSAEISKNSYHFSDYEFLMSGIDLPLCEMNERTGGYKT